MTRVRKVTMCREVAVGTAVVALHFAVDLGTVLQKPAPADLPSAPAV